MVASGTQGAVVAEGQTIRGYLRGSADPAWETEGDLTGAACVKTCTTAFLTFADRRGLFLAEHGSVSSQSLPPANAQLTVLLASGGSVILLETTAHDARLLSWRDGKMIRLRELGDGTPLWQGNSTGGTLFLLAESTATAVTVSVEADGSVRHHMLRHIPHGVMCYDSTKTGTQSLPERAYRALKRKLKHLSSCLAGPDRRWVGVSTYLTTSSDDPTGSPSTAIAVADPSGALSWSRTFQGETFALAPDRGSDLLVASDRGIEIFETGSGQAIARFEGIADASYVASRELATINRAGEARWLSY